MPLGTTTSCRVLDWDSAFFGVRIASATIPRSDDASWRAVLDWADEHSIDCLYVLTDAADAESTRRIEAAGGAVVDERVTFQRSLGADAIVADPRVRTSREGDVAALRALAATSHTASRFYADGRFPRERCDELYATWIEKSCRGWADSVLVAELDGAPVGYLSCHEREGRRGEIGIVAVAPAARGCGLGRALVDAALEWFARRGLERVSVVTQGRNEAARKLYRSRGFEVVSVHRWHHVWFDRREGRS